MLFHHATILTMNARRDILLNGAVAVQDNRILAVGKTNELLEQYPEMERFDCNGNLLLPGLIDTHIHLAQAMIRGCADDLGLLDWLGKRVWVLQGNYTAEDGRASAALCILEMIKSGTTAFIEVNLAERYGFDGVAELVIQSGIRGAIGKIVMDLPSYAKKQGLMYPGMVEDGETSLRNTLRMHERWDGAGNGRLRVWFGPRTPGGVTPELYREIARLAKERRMGITMHLSEVREDHDYAHGRICFGYGLARQTNCLSALRLDRRTGLEDSSRNRHPCLAQSGFECQNRHRYRAGEGNVGTRRQREYRL
jgi:cytosine/adenosine deaminase-related metal-dependent hydrolase